MRVLEFAFVGYPITDVPRARAFYEEVLGLTPASRFEHEGRIWLEYEVGPHTLAISNMQDDWKPSPDGAGVALEVDDFAQAMEELKAAGVKIDGPHESPVCWMALVSDPDGNTIVIHKRKNG